MRLLNGTLILSATDLTKFIRCEHVTTLDLGYTLGTLEPLAHKEKGLHAELLARKGTEHETRYIDQLGAGVVRIESTPDLEEAARKTLEAMRAGADYIHQGVVFNGRWIGYIDLLEKVATPSNLGNWSYEVADTKLARSVKPHFILQLALYSDEIGRLQGRPPIHMHIILGTGERVTLRCADFDAYYRHVRSRLERRVSDSAVTTRAYPVEFCDLCEWRMHCWRDWVANDHLSLVANIRRTHVRDLEQSDITTLTALADSPQPRARSAEHGAQNQGDSALRAPRSALSSQTYATLHHQARLQLHIFPSAPRASL